jgi:hypothetical protein
MIETCTQNFNASCKRIWQSTLRSRNTRKSPSITLVTIFLHPEYSQTSIDCSLCWILLLPPILIKSDHSLDACNITLDLLPTSALLLSLSTIYNLEMTGHGYLNIPHLLSLKQVIKTAVPLHPFVLKQDTILTTDASEKGISSVLQQNGFWNLFI